VHDGQAGRVDQIKLGDREGAAVAIPEAHWPQALDDLAQQMRDPLEGIPAPEIHRPFALDRRVRERLAPEPFRKRPIARDEDLEALAVDLGKGDRCQAHDRMIHRRSR
jgi:hypothetical protein